jgi:hypothetical protein
MQYRVPQFIEHEAKILGPLNLAQSLMVGGVIAVCFIMYFAFGQQNFVLFLLVAAVLMGGALGISFGKVEGLGLPTVMKNFMNYNVSPRIYLWRRKESTVYLSTQREAKPKVVSQDLEKKSPLKLRNEGKIEQMIKKIDFEKSEEE